jgi:hypothetical protein
LPAEEQRWLVEVGLLAAGSGIVVHLTPRGLEALRAQAPCAQAAPRIVPQWDSRSRVLTWRGKPIKRLLRPAPAQSILLTVFQEQGWPDLIDDPLPGLPDGDAPARLRDTIRNLNRGLLHGTIRFFTDGTGEGVRWGVVECPDPG